MNATGENPEGTIAPRTKRRLIAVAVLAGVAAVASAASAATGLTAASGPGLQPFRTVVVGLKGGLAAGAYTAFEARYSPNSFPAVQASYEQQPPLGAPEVWLYIGYPAIPSQFQSLMTALHSDPRVARVHVDSFSPAPALGSGCASSSASVTLTTAPLSGGSQPEVVASLRPGTSSVLGSYLVEGPVGAMAGISGSTWNYTASLRVVYSLRCDATIGQVEQVAEALRQYPFVVAVEVSLPGQG